MARSRLYRGRFLQRNAHLQKHFSRSTRIAFLCTPLESQVENYLEKKPPGKPKENERARPDGEGEKEETTAPK